MSQRQESKGLYADLVRLIWANRRVFALTSIVLFANYCLEALTGNEDRFDVFLVKLAMNGLVGFLISRAAVNLWVSAHGAKGSLPGFLIRNSVLGCLLYATMLPVSEAVWRYLPESILLVQFLYLLFTGLYLIRYVRYGLASFGASLLHSFQYFGAISGLFLRGVVPLTLLGSVVWVFAWAATQAAGDQSVLDDAYRPYVNFACVSVVEAVQMFMYYTVAMHLLWRSEGGVVQEDAFD